MVVEVSVLLARELSNANAGIDSPRIEKLVPHLGNDDQFLAAGECDVALVKQVIDVRRQKQAVGSIEALGIGRVTPRFDVTGLQVSRLIDACNTTGVLAQENVCPKNSLTSSCPNDLLAERWPGQRRIDRCCRFGVGRLRRDLKSGDRRVCVPVGLSDQADEGIGERLRHLCEVDGLQAVPALLEW